MLEAITAELVSRQLLCLLMYSLTSLSFIRTVEVRTQRFRPLIP